MQKRKFVAHQVKLATSNAANLRAVIGELPAWVNFGDVESARWLNSVIGKVWPSLNSAISQTVRDVVEPILEDVKPPFISYIGFTDFDLGNTAPEVTSIKCLPSDGDEVINIGLCVCAGFRTVVVEAQPAEKWRASLSAL